MYNILKTLYVLVLSSVLALWLMHDSVNLYWQQAYHQESPIEHWEQHKAWQLGGDLNTQAIQQKQATADQLAQFDRNNMDAINHVWFNKPIVGENVLISVIEKEVEAGPAPNAEEKCQCVVDQQTPKLDNTTPEPKALQPELAQTAESKARLNAKGQVILRKGDRVFYVGDSLMQGVAPFAKRTLYKEYGIEGLDLSKQSTGLAYPNYFNWPKVVEETFQAYDDIRLMVVYLGPNDPWAFSQGKGQPYMKFKSQEWEEVYRSRIRSLIEIAQKHNAQVIWLGAPNMKRKKLNEDMHYLNELYKSEALAAKVLYRATRDVLGSKDDKFVNFVQINGRNMKVRVDDGIHFTPTGQRLVSETILSLIEVEPEVQVIDNLAEQTHEK
ncbi:SGNH family hydrolase [Pseudomonas sp. F1_0610]|uniref:SGNH/GDSL hydrolase family protein n=1 Tax=Pseudomonas sp. F1_0610 TaxID=3114284 RepID=UPI0039C0A927